MDREEGAEKAQCADCIQMASFCQLSADSVPVGRLASPQNEALFNPCRFAEQKLCSACDLAEATGPQGLRPKAWEASRPALICPPGRGGGKVGGGTHSSTWPG